MHIYIYINTCVYDGPVLPTGIPGRRDQLRGQRHVDQAPGGRAQGEPRRDGRSG